MIRIVKWWEKFENAGSRKLKTCHYFSAPSGTDSKGYRKLMRKGCAGVTALGVFQGICQVLASLSQDARKSGEMRNSDGTLMDEDDLLDLTRLPDEILNSAIDMLVDVGWVERIEPDICQRSANDLPPSPDNLPKESQGTPNGEEGIGEEGIGEEGIGEEGIGEEGERTSATHPNPILGEVIKWINGLRESWSATPHLTAAEQYDLSSCYGAIHELSEEAKQAVERFAKSPSGTKEWVFKSRSNFIRNYTEAVSKAIEAEEKSNSKPIGHRTYKPQSLNELL